MRTTWRPHERHGRLTRQSDLPASVFAFPKQRKEPLTDARHVRNAVARFDQTTGVTDEDRALAFANIKKAARHYDIALQEDSWRDLGAHPQRHRRENARKGAQRRKRTGVAKKAAVRGAATRQRTGIARKAARKGAALRRKRRAGW
ncbi:MAG TPA: DUF6582 domain-containing protein [Steroidobacteraceae bacterium]|nr:DUF6582 domain-containing protein [Steroidobacteraceae bacterium]